MNKVFRLCGAVLLTLCVLLPTVAQTTERDAFIAAEQERLAGHPDLLAEFWARMGIEAYNAGDFSAAETYFSRVNDGANKNLLQAVALYRSEIALQLDAAQGAVTAATILSDCVTQTKLASSDALFGKIRASQARFAGLQQDWKTCETFADAALTAKDADAKKTALYWKALSLYQTEKYAKACKTIEAQKSNDAALLVLYAKALAKAGRTADADAVFTDLGNRGDLDNETRLDYARTLLNAGRLDAAAEQASKAVGAEALYLQGLAAFNQRQWTRAASFMQQSLQLVPPLDAHYASYAQFYGGYAQYRAGNYAAAYTTLTTFVRENETHPLRYDALMTAARAAVQSGQYEKSFSLAEQAVNAAPSDEQQQEAILLAAGVYTDAEKYDKALALLQQRTSGKTQFAYQCRYEVARIQALQNDYAAADKTYAALASEKNGGTYAEEAAYRRGELQYARNNYAQAAKLFEDYTKKWPGGQFADAALYFNADSLAKLGETDKAILYFMQVDNLRTESTYKYNAEKNLVDLYRSQGDYMSALGYANKLLSHYGDQARDDGIARTIEELEAYQSGGNTALTKKEREYEKAGKTTTAQGRALGTELAQLYAAATDTRTKGIDLAENLLAQQTAPAESQYAAQNALLLAQHYRQNGDAKRAAQTYLSAAQYSRAAGNDDNAARALYGATEAFDAAGLLGDARAAAESLQSLYPQSSFVKAAQQIVQK